jgi:glutaminyl-peptide cyclotransferase
MRWGLIALFLTISVGGTYLAVFLKKQQNQAPRFTFDLVDTIDHDEKAFTQGLLVADGAIWESTGRKGESSIRKIDLKTGEILQNEPVDSKYFGEGLTMVDDQLIQLTWKAGKAFVYDKNLQPVKEFTYEGQGWGITTDTNKNELIMSDGSHTLQFRDPKTFELKRTLKVRRKSGLPVGQLNELEFAGGKLFANKYLSDLVYEIDPSSGAVTSIIDLTGLWPKSDRPLDGIMNGIALVPGERTLLVTGKLCSKLYKINLVPAE